MGWVDSVVSRFLVAYREGLEMSCPAHEARQRVAARIERRREAIRATIKSKRRPAG